MPLHTSCRYTIMPIFRVLRIGWNMLNGITNTNPKAHALCTLNKHLDVIETPTPQQMQMWFLFLMMAAADGRRYAQVQRYAVVLTTRFKCRSNEDTQLFCVAESPQGEYSAWVAIHGAKSIWNIFWLVVRCSILLHKCMCLQTRICSSHDRRI